MQRISFLRPAKGLEGIVRCYVQELGQESATVIHPVHARGTPILAFCFGDKTDAHHCDGKLERTHNVDLVGMQTHQRLHLHFRGTIDSFFVLFQPTGLNRLFSLPMHEFTDQDLDAELVMGPMIARLHQRLGECRSALERVSVMDQFLLGRVKDACALDGVSAAANLIIRRGGCESISSIAGRAGLSMRQLERRFMQQVGMGPKLLARIARFEAVMDSMARASIRSWTSAAHRFGYFDQMHMVHEFAEFTGQTPTETLSVFRSYFREVLSDIQSDADTQAPLRETRLVI